ncbi:MAG TPA: replication factor C large subunit [Terriglobales bacterium]|nr:replication factor C large subunit [Terriglobales bacterium]
MEENEVITQPNVAWTEKYRPKTASMLLGNETAVEAFKAWLKQWTLKKKPTKACLLVGPPGVGKTTLARAAANDYNFRVVEMNASDVRTEKAIRTALVPASTSLTLDTFSLGTRGNLILLDEVDGVFGREDRGGLAAILSAIKQAPVPIVLTANNVDDERFDDLKKACIVLPLYEIRPRLLVALITHVISNENQSLDAKVIKRLAQESYGDIRSALNDVQAVATSGIVTLRSTRTRELSESETIRALFANKGFSASRRALNETDIPLYRDDLLLLLHDLLPYIYTEPDKLAEAYDSLSRADMGYGRVGASRSRGVMPPPFNRPQRSKVPEWSLLPVALNELASVGSREPDSDVDHALQIAPRVSQKTADRYQYRLWALDHLSSRVARVCHTSKRKSLLEIVPSLIALFRISEDVGRNYAAGLELEERDIEFLVSESKTQPAAKGPQQLLDPRGFKLPFMGKDKFIQLMRAGIAYDRAGGQFTVRKLDNLDAVEDRLNAIVGKPVKFARPGETPTNVDENSIQECYVDGASISCDACEFVENCSTHTIPSLKFCLCDHTMADPKSYEEYVAKNSPPAKPVKQAKSKRVASRKKA